jgi:hypothetical protein
VLCPECHQFNPDNNRFCGMCGQQFQDEPVSHYPREGFDETDLPEIADIDPRIPANEYAPTRRAAVDPVPEIVDRRDPDAFEEEQVPLIPAKPIHEDRPRSTTSIFDLEPRESDRPKFETDPRAVKPVTYGTNMFEYDPVAAERSNTSLHGPSFLGLGEPDFLDDIEEPRSHARLYWLMLALLAVIGVGAMQWRNIRDTGMQYAGTMHLSLPDKKGEGPAKITPEQATPSSSGETSAAAEGKPEMIVGATNNNGQKPAPPDNNATPSQSAAAPNSPTPEPNKSAANSGGAMQGSEDTKKTGSKETASNKKPDENSASSKDDSSDTSEADSADETPAPAKSARSARAAAKRPVKAIDESASTAGADDLARAEKATDPATAANWLWAATKKGNAEAPVRLADYYANGRGVPKDCEQATVLLRSSARRGNPRARARLGMYYATGQCVVQDRAQAWHWLTLAHQADPGSDWIEQYRQRLWSQMSPDERSRSNASSTASE